MNNLKNSEQKKQQSKISILIVALFVCSSILVNNADFSYVEANANNSPTITNINVTPNAALIGEDITITAEVIDPDGVAAVSADFSFDLAFTDRPTPISVAMVHISGDQYQVIYKVPDSWIGHLVYIKVAARDTLNNYIRSDDYKTVIAHPYTWYVDDNLFECPNAEFSNIQTAISNVDVWSGDAIMVCPGTYNEKVIVDKSLTIKSTEGSNLTILDGTGISGNGFSIQTDDVAIYGFTIQNFSTASNGIYLDNVEKIRIVRNEIKNNVNGIKMTGSNDIKIKRNDIYDNNENGIYVYEISSGASVNDVEISQNEIYNHSTSAGSGGIFASTDGNWKNNQWDIKRNELTNNNYGIKLFNIEQTRIARNKINQSDTYGIYLHSKNGVQINQIKIERNRINNSLTSGIYIIADVNSSLENIEIARNKIYNSKDGIWLKAESANSKIKNSELNRNKIYDNSGLGAAFSGSGCSQNLIKKNKIYRNGGNGLEFSNGTDNNFILSNQMKENGGSGIYIKSSDYNLVEKNKSYFNSFNGIALIDGSNNTIKKNRTKNNGNYDLYYDGGGTGNSSSKNKFKTSAPPGWWN